MGETQTESVIELREPCKSCGGSSGRCEMTNGQDVVRCQTCDKYQYCRPKTESGRTTRTVSRDEIKPKQRARILERANGCCEICRVKIGGEIIYHVGHLLSVKDGELHGVPADVVNSDDNYAAMCEECNLGFGERSVNVRLYLAILKSRMFDGLMGGEDMMETIPVKEAE